MHTFTAHATTADLVIERLTYTPEGGSRGRVTCAWRDAAGEHLVSLPLHGAALPYEAVQDLPLLVIEAMARVLPPEEAPTAQEDLWTLR